MSKPFANLPFLLVVTTLIAFLLPLCQSQKCNSYTFPNKNTYVSCVDLPVLNSFLHWNYTASTSTADIAFRRHGAKPSNWISWAINPAGKGMVGSQALVAYMTSSGSVYAYTSSVDSYGTDLPEGKLSFRVPSISAAYEGGEMIIFARLQLTGSNVGPGATQVWQEGPMKGDGVPGMHPTSGANMKSVARLNFAGDGAGAGSKGGGVSSGGDDGKGDLMESTAASAPNSRNVSVIYLSRSVNFE